MRCLVRTVVTQKNTLEYRDAEYVLDELTLGRANNSTLLLDGRGVLPNHAVISVRRDGKITIKADGGAELIVNGKLQRAAALTQGDQFQLGPNVHFEVIAAPHGFDLALSLTKDSSDTEDTRLEFTPGAMRLQDATWGRRRWAWILSIAVLVLGLALPLAWSLMSNNPDQRPAHWPVTDNIWLSGPLHSAHRIPGLVDNCSACHQTGFMQVTDAACEACHSTPDHIQHEEKSSSFADLTCTGCHREHNEPTSLVRSDEGLCVDCHGSINDHWEPPSKLRDVPGFESHPAFKLSLLQQQGNDWVISRVDQTSATLVEHSNLKFSHQQHLNEDGIDGPQGNTLMVCADCHQPQQDGLLMQPISMEAHCASCHTLAFEATDPERQVPHDKPAEVLRDLEEYYARLYSIQGGPVESVHELSRPAQRPGKPSKTFYAAMKAWADERALDAAQTLMEESACHSCHEVTVHADKSLAERWQVQPVRLSDTWMPLAQFDHRAHTQMECEQCHEASHSEQPEDVLMPDLASCQQCHGGENSSSMVSTGCMGCHGYHQNNHLQGQ